MAKEYDVVIIGGGPGGYVAAIRASQLGLSVALVEKDALGGTCLHRGCIPTKAMLRSAELYRQAQQSAKFGIEIEGVTVQFEKVRARKYQIIAQLQAGVVQLMKKGKIAVYYGTGRILGPSIFSPLPGTISVEMTDGAENEMLIPKYVIVATGSRPRLLEGLHVDGKLILTSDELLQLEQLPQSIVIVGGGVIGIEWASMLHDFGVKVTVLEYGPRILPTEDIDISEEMLHSLGKRGIHIITEAKFDVDQVKRHEDEVEITLASGDIVKAEKLLVSVGRVANVENIGLENTEIMIENGCIVVNEFYQTKERHIYAIGDVIGGMQLAHVASHEGIRAVEHMVGETHMPIHYANIARCVYGAPEIASVGLTEEQARNSGYKVKTEKFSFKGNGKALVYGESEGFVKVVADLDSNDAIGVHIIGPHATDLISEAALGLFLNASPWEVGAMVHPHPTLSEVIGEAALAIDGRAIHR
ncbi:MAG: dihydrolipoyl dehydrogenase [Solibacillus sp.]